MRLITAMLVLVGAAGAYGQVPIEDPVVEEVATGFRFAEGPALSGDGSIYFSDVPMQRVHRYDPQTGETTLILEHSGGANGLAFDGEGRLVLCEGRARRLSRLDDAGRVGLVQRYEGRRLNSPNDLAVDAGRGVYFTDPRYGTGDDRELDVEGVYYWPAAGGEVRQIIVDLRKPNGIALSPDGGTLYVADNGASTIVAYDVLGPGEIGEGREFGGEDGAGGPDGLTVDALGQVYAAWHGGGGVHVWSRDGTKRGFIAMPQHPTNLVFGADGRTLYVTTRNSLYRVR